MYLIKFPGGNMVILYALGMLYIAIGVYINYCVFDVMKKIPEGHKHYNQAQEVINNLKKFLCFTLSIFRWPGLIRTIYFGGN